MADQESNTGDRDIYPELHIADQVPQNGIVHIFPSNIRTGDDQPSQHLQKSPLGTPNPFPNPNEGHSESPREMLLCTLFYQTTIGLFGWYQGLCVSMKTSSPPICNKDNNQSLGDQQKMGPIGLVRTAGCHSQPQILGRIDCCLSIT